MAIDATTPDQAHPDGRSPGEMAAHIARVAARLFAARGYDATSVREIVEAAGVTKPTLYYHFGSKQGLAEALLTRPMDEFVDRLKGLVEAGLEPVELLRRTISVHMDFLNEEPDRARFFYAICFGAHCTSLQEEIHHFGVSIESEMLACARYVAELGLIDQGRAEAFASMCRGAIVLASLDFLFGGEEPDPAMPDRVVRDLLDGFAKGRPSTIPERGPRR